METLKEDIFKILLDRKPTMVDIHGAVEEIAKLFVTKTEATRDLILAHVEKDGKVYRECVEEHFEEMFEDNENN